jgi:hypothetical protein
MRERCVGAVSAIVLVLIAVVPALAWNDTGHQVVALIAWNTLSEPTRMKVVELLRQAPADADLANLFRQDGRPVAVRQREFVRLASTWADLVRDESKPQRFQKYHRSTWHHRNYFWKPESGGPVDLPNMPVNPENAIERLGVFKTALTDASTPARDRAVGLAWVLHLVGDVHQPLHCSGRVTAGEPEGDRGGNLFKLGQRSGTLHAYWDSALDKAVQRKSTESLSTYLERAAGLVVARHPRILMEDRLKPGQFEEWAQESLAAAKQAYPATLRRRQEPDGTYRQATARTGMERAAFGGYRLAALLEETLGTR